MIRLPPRSTRTDTLFPYTTLFRSNLHGVYSDGEDWECATRSADRLLKLSPNDPDALRDRGLGYLRSEEHTSELQSLMRISYAVFCLNKKKTKPISHHENTTSQVQSINTIYTLAIDHPDKHTP